MIGLTLFVSIRDAHASVEQALARELTQWQPFNKMVESDELTRVADELLRNNVSAPLVEETAKKAGLSSGRLGWVRAKAQTPQHLANALIREAFDVFQDGEFDRFGAKVRRVTHGWEALLLVERRAALISNIPKQLELGQRVHPRATWALPNEAEALLSWHVQLPSGETQEGTCLSNGLCPLPAVSPTRNGWLVLQVMVDRGMGPEVGYSRHLAVGEPNSKRIRESRSKASRLPGRQLLETLLNKVRRDAELPPLEFDGLLHEIAAEKARVVASTRTFGHRLRGHRSPGVRLVDADVAFSRIVETIADGSNVEALVRQWLASPAHRAKILDPTLRRAGLGLMRPSQGRRSFTSVLLLTDELG